MELKEAFDIIDATLGMFRTFAGEIENGDLKEKFLMTPVYTSVENVYDANKYDVKIEVRSYYNYVEGDKEYKRYIVDIRPICSYLVNEWPSYKAKRIRKKLIAVTSECANYCETYLGGIADVAEDDGFSYDRYVRTVYDKLPKDFKTSEAEQLMQKLVNAGLLNNNWKPVNLSIAERGYLADEITNRLNINYKWKVMGELWNENPGTLRKGKNNAIEQKKTGAFIEKLKDVLG